MCATGAKAKGPERLYRVGAACLGWRMTGPILCFGDSNTYGTPPMRVRGGGDRFGREVRWPARLAALTGREVIEEGLPGRTACGGADPEMGAHMDGPLGLRIALQSHGPIDRLIVMLGTNDLKAHFGRGPEAIAAGIATLLQIAVSDDMQARHGGFSTLLVCPPPILETGVLAALFLGGAETSNALWPHCRALAEAHGVAALEAGAHIESSAVDGIHLEPGAHARLAEVVAEALG